MVNKVDPKSFIDINQISPSLATLDFKVTMFSLRKKYLLLFYLMGSYKYCKWLFIYF